MFSNVIVDITFPLRPHVFAQSLLWGFCQSLRCRKLGSQSNWSNKPLPVKEQLQRRLHPTKHSPTYCNYWNKPQRNSYDYSNHTVHKGRVWEHLGIPKPFNIHVTHKLITTLRQLRTYMKDKDEPKNRQSGLYEAHNRLGLCSKRSISGLPNLLVILLNICGSNIHSVRSLNTLDSASASTFLHPGKYVALSQLLLAIHRAQICLATWLHGMDLLPPMLFM